MHLPDRMLHRDCWKYTIPLFINQIGWGGGVTMYSFIMRHDRAFSMKLPVPAVAFILTLDEFVKIAAVYRHYMKYQWVKNITKEET